MSRRRQRPRKTPMLGRFLGAVCGALALSTAAPAAAKTWTYETVTAAVAQRSGAADLADAADRAERAAGRDLLQAYNPFLGLSHQQVLAPTSSGFTSEAEDNLYVGQTFDLSFRRDTFAASGDKRGAAARLQADALLRRHQLRVTSLFAQGIAAQRRMQAVQAWQSTLQTMLRRMQARAAQGDASTFDVMVVQRQLAQADLDAQRQQLQARRVRAELAVWLDDDADALVLSGALAPPPAPATGGDVDGHPSLSALQLQADAARVERDGWSRSVIPPVTAQAGGRSVWTTQGFQPDEIGTGVLLQLQVPLPVFERREARQSRLGADADRWGAQHKLQKALLQSRASSALVAWRSSLQALQTHQARAAHTTQLVSLAQAAWEGGELPLLSLLQVERAVVDDELLSIDLEEAARQGQLTHDALADAAIQEKTP